MRGGSDGENLGVPGVLVLDILDRTAPLDTTHGETRRVAEAADNARLPFEGAGDALVDLGRIGQIDHVDVALRRRNDEQLVLHIHAVYALAGIERPHWLLRLQIPELDALVPGARRDVVLAARLEPAHAFDGFGVRFCLDLVDLAGCWGLAEVDNVQHASRIARGKARAVLGWS